MNKSKFLIGLVNKTIDEVNTIVAYPASEYARDTGVSTEKVQESKLERIGNLVNPLKHFIDYFEGAEDDQERGNDGNAI